MRVFVLLTAIFLLILHFNEMPKSVILSFYHLMDGGKLLQLLQELNEQVDLNRCFFSF